MMKCRRCQGFLVQDSIYSLDGQFYHIEVLRCLNCGETIDGAILKSREVNTHRTELPGKRVSSRKAC
jgi:hypothetical protein